MQASRYLSKLPRTLVKQVSSRPLVLSRKMSLFPRAFYGSDPSFTPLFRLLDDFDTYSREVSDTQPQSGRGHRHVVRTFNPRFDVRETETAYELHGELPGIDKKDVHIEFTDGQTVVIRGRVERSYTSGTPPAGVLGQGAVSGAITEAGEGEQQTEKPAAHKATVEDEGAEAEPAASSTEVAKKSSEKAPEHGSKYWASERSVGEFSRSFSFPSRVDSEAVRASLDNGILNVVVPKAKKLEARRIAIN